MSTKYYRLIFFNLIVVNFRALNKKLRAEELLKLSKLPPSMAKREEVYKLKENLEDCLRASSAINKHVEILTQKKKKLRKKNRKVKSSTNPIKLKRSDYSQCSRSYVYDMKRDKDKGSVKVRQSKCVFDELINSYFFVV